MYTGLIYCAISPSMKKYYGKTTIMFEVRKNKHKRDANKNDSLLFHKAIRKYGFNNFIWNIIESYSFLTKNELLNKLNEQETYWIKKDKTYLPEFGYNMTMGGDGGDTFSGKKHSKKTLSKMKKSRLKYLKNHNHALLGKKRPEHSKKILGNNNGRAKIFTIEYLNKKFICNGNFLKFINQYNISYNKFKELINKNDVNINIKEYKNINEIININNYILYKPNDAIDI